MKLRSIVALTLLSACAFAAQEEDKKSAWDVSSPPGERRDIPIDTHSGTWMSVDVSPDGKRVVFDMLGDVYDLPIEGGEARALASGMAWEMQPRYSPDGKWIAFTSDRGGGDNLWIMDANGGNARQISKESFRLLNNPCGIRAAATSRAASTSRRDARSAPARSGCTALDGGDGVQLVKRPGEEFQKELGEPAFSPDGKYLYYSQNVTPGNTFEYAQDVNKSVFSILRYELATGETEAAVSEPGGGVRPTPSPDGRWLAFVHRVRTPQAFETALFVKDLVSGQERSLYMDLDRDMQETWAINGLYPNMDWTPDSKTIVFWAGGGIKRIDRRVRHGERHPVPRQRDAHRDEAAARRRARCTGRNSNAHGALRERLTGRQAGRVRIVRTPVAEERGRRRAATPDARGNGVRAVPFLVA